MRIETGLNGSNRKLLAQEIGEHLHDEPHYNGVPTCSYSIGTVTVERDGAIVSDDTQAWEALTTLFQTHGWLPTDADSEAQGTSEETEEALMLAPLEPLEESSELPTSDAGCEVDAVQVEPDEKNPLDDLEAATEPQPETVEPSGDLNVISVPVGDMVVDQMKNLIFMLHSKQYLLNRALGSDLLHIPDALVNRLMEYRPEDMDAFATMLDNYKALSGLSGFILENDQVSMTFPFDEAHPERCRVYTELFCRIVRLAKAATRVNPELQKPENEKYYLRSWLIRLGMGGADFKEARHLLLHDLTGYAAFPTDAAAQRHKEKYAAIRRAEHDAPNQSAVTE